MMLALCASTFVVTGSILTGLSIHFWKEENKKWNNGKCPECSEQWLFIGYDEYDNRLYTCGKHSCLISFKNIDNK